MFASLIALTMANHQKVIHFDLGKVDGLTLTADFDVDVHDQLPVLELGYKLHLFAKDSQRRIVDRKDVDLYLCFREPNSLIVEDRFKKGYKQVFVSLQYGGIVSYLFAFKNRKFYTAFASNAGRVYTRALKSRPGTWLIEESDNVIHYTILEGNAGNGRKGNMEYAKWRISPRTKPILHVSTGPAE
jgi:hypothetical protein